MIVGEHFGRWVIVSVAPCKQGPGGHKQIVVARCQCGVERKVNARALRDGYSKSCGCLKAEVNRARLAVTNVKPGAPFRKLLAGYQYAAAERGLAWELSDEYFAALTVCACHYCGAPPLKVEQSNSGERYTWNGIDRKDSSKGYTAGNCVPCCETCNRMKMSMDFEEFVAQCRCIAGRFRG